VSHELRTKELSAIHEIIARKFFFIDCLCRSIQLRLLSKVALSAEATSPKVGF